MGYDLRITRQRHPRTGSPSEPIDLVELDQVIAGDPELAWSTADYVDMVDESGVETRHWMIAWQGRPCFWWCRGEIQCTSPDARAAGKMAQMADALDALLIGDDGNEQRRGRPEVVRGFTSAVEDLLRRWGVRWQMRETQGDVARALPFVVGDEVRDSWGNAHTVVAIDRTAENGLGAIRTRRSDATDHVHTVVAHGLSPVRR